MDPSPPQTTGTAASALRPRLDFLSQAVLRQWHKRPDLLKEERGFLYFNCFIYDEQGQAILAQTSAENHAWDVWLEVLEGPAAAGRGRREKTTLQP